MRGGKAQLITLKMILLYIREPVTRASVRWNAAMATLVKIVYCEKGL